MKEKSERELWAQIVGEAPAEYLAGCDLKALGSLGDEELGERFGSRRPEGAAAVRAVVELARRLATRPFSPGHEFRCSEDVFGAYRATLGLEEQENFRVLLLDGKNRLIRDVLVSVGSLSASIVHPREVFSPAVRERAAGVILAHNHPSGDPEPSRDDIELTGRLREAGTILGIAVIDHVIVGRESYYSFVDRGQF